MRIHLDIDTDGLEPETARVLARLVLASAGVPVETVTVDGGDVRHLATFDPGAAEPFDDTRNPAAVFTPPKSDADTANRGIYDSDEDDTSTLYEAAGGTLPTVDKHGVPWDARIHSTPANLSAGSGEWRRKRGVQESLVSTVIQEMTAAGRIRVPQTPAPTVTPTVPAAPPPPVIADTPQMRFGRVMKKITAAQTAGKLSATRPTEIAAQLGLASVAALFSTGADQLDAFEAIIDSELA